MSMNGIDIASYQSGIDLSVVPCDFVIVKATQGTGYVNPDYDRATSQAISVGKKLGVYHYVNGSGAQAEADYFVGKVAPVVGKAVLCIDWESNQNAAWKNESYLQQLVQRVIDRTGVRPLIYVQQSRLSAVKPVADALNCGLWVAQYASDDPTGYQSTPWNEGAYSCAIRQYSSVGRLDGWGGNLDLNKAYMDSSAWDKYANPSSAPTAEPEEPAKTVDVPQEAEGSVYRLYNPANGDHLFTLSQYEAQSIANAGWTYEGVAWSTDGTGDIVYRLYNPTNGFHMFTVSHDEHDSLIKAGWYCEGMAFTSPEDGKDVYRLYNPGNGAHHFTVSADERAGLVAAGWTDEGAVFKAR